jgi:hypothetical protein
MSKVSAAEQAQYRIDRMGRVMADMMESYGRYLRDDATPAGRAAIVVRFIGHALRPTFRKASGWHADSAQNRVMLEDIAAYVAERLAANQEDVA